MALFRRKKKVAKPTAKEQKRILARLRAKYPQMFEPRLRRAERKVISRAAPSERRALEKMAGYRLKRKYKKK